MPLSNSQIKAAIDAGRIKVSPFDPELVRPSSLDIRLGSTLKVISDDGVLDLASEDSLAERYSEVQLIGQGYELLPRTSVLGSALESISFGSHCGIVLTRSSLARMGLLFSVYRSSAAAI